MREVLHQIWPEIKGELLKKLNKGIPRRLDTCIKNEGGSTKY